MISGGTEGSRALIVECHGRLLNIVRVYATSGGNDLKIVAWGGSCFRRHEVLSAARQIYFCT